MTLQPQFTLNNLDLLRSMQMEAEPGEDVDVDAFSIQATANAQLLDHKQAVRFKMDDSRSGGALSTKRSEEEEEENRERDLQNQKSLFLCYNPPPQVRRQTLELPDLFRRKASAGRTARVNVSSNSSRGIQPKEAAESDWRDSQESGNKNDDSHFREMTLTEKRTAMIRNKFSSRNLFNVQRQNMSSSFNHGHVYGKTDNASDSSGASATPGRFLPHQRPFGGSQTRPVTSVSTFQGRQLLSNGGQKLRSRPTTTPSSSPSSSSSSSSSSSRASSFRNQYVSTTVDRFLFRKPRSRRQLEKMTQMRVDPFSRTGDVEEVEEETGEEDPWMSVAARGVVHQDLLLQRVRNRGSCLQKRVSSFLKDLDDFNSRGHHKSGLEHILEMT